ncbi:MAG: hypothetical protein H0U59_11860, partial [Gemmatimonadaceae bacterium]|nr:hypothetical protein [Gemmatimonadaceae bacterium]
MRFKVDEATIAALPEAERKEAQELLAEIDKVLTENPLHGFHPHSVPQREFFEARTPIQAAFAGNRFGKSASLVVKSLVQLVDEVDLPDHLLPYKVWGKGEPCFGRIVVPDLTATLEGVMLAAFRKWSPKAALRGSRFDQAWDKQRRMLNFKNGSWLQMTTYEMDVDKFGGAALHFVGYDEPPPQDIRNECMMRLIDYGGFEMFAMTPLMGIGWIYRNIWKRREHPHITVIRGSIHDNPTLDQTSKERALTELSGTDDPNDPERRARETGEFAHFGGMVYPDGFNGCLMDPPSLDRVRGWDIVIGIDPGLRNAAFVWVGFDQDHRAFVFDEQLLQDRTPTDYVKAIRSTNAKWGIANPLYVIDPSARNRSLVNAESVEAEFQRLGIYPISGQNQVEPGVQQIRRRIANKMFYVSKDCRGLRDEAEEYRV